MKHHLLLPFLLLSPLLLLTGATRPESIGPFGGSAAIVEVDPYRPGTVVAATSNALLFRSVDNGDSWTRMPFPGELHGMLHALSIAPATGMYLVGLADNTRQHSGIFASSDGGRSWRRLQALGQKQIWCIAVWPLDARIIAAGAEDGVFLSRDSGQTWRRISPESNPALAPVVSLAFDTTDSRTIYAGTPHLPWRTMDEGKSWEPADAGMPDDSDVFSIHIDETRPLHLFASACSGIYHSTNQGTGWTRLVEPSDASFRTYQITQDPGRPEVLFAGTAHGLIRSTNRGKTWRKLSGHMTRWITFDRTRPGRIFLATDEAGILRSDDLGESLSPVNTGFCNRRVLSFTAAEDAIYASLAKSPAGGGIFRRAGSAQTWESLGMIPQVSGQPVVKMVSGDDGSLYAITPKSLRHSSDGGRTWTPMFLPSPIADLTALVVTQGRRLLVGTEDGIWYTDDAGKLWLAARSPKGQSATRSMVGLGGRAVAATTSSGLLVARDGVDFRPVTSSGGAPQITGLVATEHNGWLAATARGLARSDDLGATWRPVPGPLDGDTVSAICTHPTKRDVLFASRYGTVFGSEDEGRSWMPITPQEGGLQAIDELVVTKGIPGAIFAVTHSQGIYVISAGPAFALKGSSPNQSTRSTPVSGRLWPPF